MAQLTSIITSQLAWGSVGLVFSGLFGIAVRMEWNAQLAPRTSNRPKSVLKNVLDHKTPFVNIYPLAFLLWAWKLSYPNGLMGISGTGSRNNGWAGPTLKWNLDGVILLKYHKMLLKISVLATVLCLFVLLPAYITATCDPTMLGLQTCARLSNLTDFENLTIAHIPDKVWQDSLSRPATNNSNNNPMEGVLWVPGVSLRTLLVVVCCCILYTYTLYLLWYEWMDNLALRRVFFLEADHYPRRIKELDEITAIQGIIPVDPVTSERPPYIPDPELRDTPPAVSLYSVLYQLPESLLTYDTDGATQLERQIVATTNFFDQCVPPQAGYTSSVAAVTIVPDAAKVAKAWMKWYKVETKLRRLRYLRSLLQKKLQKEMDGSTDVYDAIAGVVHHSKHGIETTATTVAAAVSQAARTATQTAKNATHNIAQSLNKVRTPNKGKLATMPEENEQDRDDVMNEMIGEEHAPLVMTGQGPEKDTLDTTQPATDVVQEDGGEEVTVEFVSGKALEVETSPRRSGAESASDKSDTGSATQQHDESGGNPFVSLWSRWVGNGDDVTSQHTAANGVDIEMQPIMDKKASTEEIDEDSSSTFSAKPSPSSRRIRSEILASDEVEVTPEIEQAMDFFYDDFDVKRYAKKLGFDEETELVDIVDGLGIEELSVFAREYAQSSANPCVYGMSPHLLNFKSIEELQEMEHELWEDLRDCNAELIAARKQAVEHADDEEGFVTSGAEAKNSDDEFEYEANGDEIGRISIPSPTLKAFCGEQTGGLRNRHAFSASDDQWGEFVGICCQADIVPFCVSLITVSGLEMAKEQAAGMRYVPESEWNGDGQKRPWLRRHMPCCREPLKALPKYYGIMEGTGKAFVTALDHPTYAVVTFTSRQAAIAARQSLADGGATNTWKQVDDIPIPPLADAPPRNLLFFRGCCRPVTLTINYKEKKLRRWSVIVVLFFFCCLYTIPLTFIQHLLDPETLTKWFPDAEGLKDPTSQTYRALSRLAGPFSGLMYTLFFSFLPQVFKWLAFFDGTSSSMEKAERYALLLYWYFMLVTAFTGTALANMFFAWINADLSTEETIRQVRLFKPSCCNAFFWVIS
jgi:hypothetical protein